MELFGFKVGKNKEDVRKGTTFVPPTKEDGALEVEVNDTTVSNFAAQLGYTFDLENIPNDEYELIQAYRKLSLEPEVDEGVQEIINDAIITEDRKQSVSIILDELDLSDKIKDKIVEEFEEVLNLLDFKNNSYNIFRRWYIDGRLYYHKVIDKNKPQNGISDVIHIDPFNIKLVREIKQKNEGGLESPLYDLKDVQEYYIYASKPIIGKENQAKYNHKTALKIPKEAVTFVPSGLVSADGKIILSYLYKSIKPFNDMRLMEDSSVIYRVARAPEKRVFYIDVGNLPKNKAEQYLKDVMNRFRNKVVYDVATGKVNNRKKFMSMIEDYWLPRREGGRGTEISTLPGGENLGVMEDVEYFKTKFYKSLGVPMSRFQSDGQPTAFNIGRTTEITRDEVKFNKFIKRLRKKFSFLFDDLLKTQLVLKKIITLDEWKEIQHDITYSFLEDNYFSELKELEVWNDKLNLIQQMQQAGVIGKYISHDTVRREIMKQSEEMIKEEDKKIVNELSNETFNPKEEDQRF